ncbi:hypothetical protein [Marinobacter zhejiangensis]|uniref:Uncharacterized protein n=1 Tax=Marinobacter zhejiangensis TaxID=488535 RepID=A0A1I4LB53_9GAMM|nr:hypothetical protein [Marinobacter zhejiangensis]SFL88023.1 hypothetical protein SAMN04487963_0376 [Marinobacter zhejiangensis]
MTNLYSIDAYRSSHIPTLPPGGHPKMDRAFQRLPWGHYQSPVVPNTMKAQLAYACLFKEEQDAEDGFPWGEAVFTISRGFFIRLQSALYMLYLMAALGLAISAFGVLILVFAILSDNPSLKDFINLIDALKWFYAVLFGCFFGGKYGRLFLASLNEKRLRSDPTGLYRREGLVRIKLKHGMFEAPFIEFDAYRIHTPSGRGGRYYNLLLQHRYSNTQLWMKGLVTDAMNPKDINAYWSMIQQYMDVSGPLPDVPIFEPFRQRDPVTEAADRESGRDPFFWRNMSNDQWRGEYESDYQQRLQHADFNEHSYHSCILDAHIQGRGLPLPDGPQGAMLA